jgi:hypothetical protein
MSIHPFQKVTNFAILIPKCVHLPHMSFQFESLNRPLSPRIEVRLDVNQALLHKSVSPLLELKSTDAASLPPILNPSSLGGHDDSAVSHCLLTSMVLHLLLGSSATSLFRSTCSMGLHAWRLKQLEQKQETSSVKITKISSSFPSN